MLIEFMITVLVFWLVVDFVLLLLILVEVYKNWRGLGWA